MSTIETAGALRPGTANTPLDQRSVVNALADISDIELPFLGQIVYCIETSSHYKITGLKDKQVGAFTIPNAAVDTFDFLTTKGEPGEPGQALDANYIDISTVTDGYLVVSAETIPVSVEINNAVYPVLGMVKEGDTFKIPTAPILASANIAEYSGTWRIWRAGGKQGVDGEPGIPGGTFPIALVDALPESPDSSTLYLIPLE